MHFPPGLAWRDRIRVASEAEACVFTDRVYLGIARKPHARPSIVGRCEYRKRRETKDPALNNALLLQRLDLAGIIAEFPAQHLLGVLAEQRRSAVSLDRRAGEGQRVADQR